MKGIFRSLVILLASLPSTMGAFYGKNSQVVNLDESNFQEKVIDASHNKVVMVEFYAPWCGHCKALKPAWNEAAKKLKGVVTIAAIDANDEKNRGIAGQYGIKGFPSIKIFKNGVPSDFNGGRDAQSIINAGYAALTSYSKRLSKKTAEKFFENDAKAPKAVLLTKSGSTPMYWKALSMLFNGAMAFAEIKAKEKGLIDQFKADYEGLKAPGLVVFPEGKSGPHEVYNGPMKLSPIKTFLKKFAEIDDGEEYVLPELVDQSCMEKHCGSAALCVLVVTSSGGAKDAKPVIQQVEEGREDSLYSFTWIDNQKQKKFLKKAFDMDPQEFPQVVVLSPRKKRYSLLVGSFNAEGINRSLTRVLRGGIKTAPLHSGGVPKLEGSTQKCKKSPKPKPKPTPSKPKASPKSSKGSGSKIGGSVELTEKTFDTLVLKSKSPWMIEFYAPWCGHCKSLAPHWKKAALKMRGMVKFGAVDATAHKQLASKYVVKGYPTIKYFGEGLPKEAQDYQYGRTAKILSRFAKTLMTSKHIGEVQSGEAETFISTLDGDTPRALLVTNKASPPELWRALSTEFQGDIKFGIVSNAEDGILGVKNVPGILLKTLKADKPIIYKGELNMPAIASWLYESTGITELTPESISKKAAEEKKRLQKEKEEKELLRKMVHNIDSQKDFDALCSKGSTVCAVAFVSENSSEEEVKRGMETMQSLVDSYAKKSHSPFRFVIMDGRKSKNVSKFRDVFGVSDDMSVALVAMVPKRSRFQVMVGVFDAEHAKDFLDNLIRGKIKTASLKSWPSLDALAGTHDEL